MAARHETEPQSIQRDADATTRLGGWLFKYRTSIPLPIAAALLLIPSSSASPFHRTLVPVIGVLVVAAGETVRLWAVHHIGVISRTRSDRLGPLVDTGPFSRVRNPLYLGNILLWLGFACAARLVWLAPAILLVLAVEYHAIVRWEERLLELRLGSPYRTYLARVPRWIPRLGASKNTGTGVRFSWRDTLYSERGTLIAIAIGFGLLAIKSRVFNR